MTARCCISLCSQQLNLTCLSLRKRSSPENETEILSAQKKHILLCLCAKAAVCSWKWFGKAEMSRNCIYRTNNYQRRLFGNNIYFRFDHSTCVCLLFANPSWKTSMLILFNHRECDQGHVVVAAAAISFWSKFYPAFCHFCLYSGCQGTTIRHKNHEKSQNHSIFRWRASFRVHTLSCQWVAFWDSPQVSGILDTANENVTRNKNRQSWPGCPQAGWEMTAWDPYISQSKLLPGTASKCH